MSTEQTEAPQWGAPPPPAPPRSRWTVRRIVVAVAIAVGITAAAGVAIYAAGGATASGQAGPGGGRGDGGGGRMIVGGPLGGMSGTQHGEFQTGEVTEVTDDSITAKSDDGYTKTYVIDDETDMPGEVAEGDDVTIVATTEGSTTTAESVMERGAMPQRRDGDGGGPPGDGNAREGGN